MMKRYDQASLWLVALGCAVIATIAAVANVVLLAIAVF